MLNHLAVARVFNALGDPTRRALVEQLSRGPASISALTKPLDITLAAVVQHIQVLEESGVIRTEKVGRIRTCHIAPNGLDVAAQWIAERRTLWERRFDRLGELLMEDEEGPHVLVGTREGGPHVLVGTRQGGPHVLVGTRQAGPPPTKKRKPR
jgi:DNA-binding transcriptional ArsR family regulator